ncbi:MAG: 2-aminoethylphosphonate--pyruvate transaminase [Coriobacteriia bacterium]|nr:2-aminoethylphosphonate--pyruvate transaminase [Coriobacteriia bacterium]
MLDYLLDCQPDNILDYIPDNPYLLLTPGPLSTSRGVRAALLRDWCTWDADYNEEVVQNVRRRLVALATAHTQDYTAVLMQGSGSFSVEACLGSALGPEGKLLIMSNGAYGKRMVTIAETLRLNHVEYALIETEAPSAQALAGILAADAGITHVAMVHCETTTGMLNPLDEIAAVVRDCGKIFIVDAMSSFGGIPFDVDELGIDFLISSSNKCIQGVPGFGFVIARRAVLAACEGNARSHCLDLYDQWREMDPSGKWRFTSPTHTVRAFYAALDELEAEGGVSGRHARYCQNRQTLVDGMRALGFETLLEDSLLSPIITSFLYPSADFDFGTFYQKIKQQGFVLYPGKISAADTFRIGNIGEVYPADIERLLEVIRGVVNH